MPSPAPSSTTTATGQRAAIYLRESALEAARPDRYGIPVQRDQCRACCDDNGYTVIDEYLDKGADSEELERPEMNRLRRDIREGRVDVVVIARYDRLARDPGLQNFLLYEAEKVYGVPVVFADPDEQYEDNATGLLLRTIKGIANQQARADIRKKTQAARRKRASEGKLIPGGKPIYGYVWRDAKKTALDIDPETAPIVRRLYREVLAGVSLYRLTVALQQEGVPLPTRKPDGYWHQSSLVRILRNPAYIGEYDAYHIQSEKHRHLRRDGAVVITKGRRERAADDPARIRVPEGVIPPLVDRADWDIVQRILDSNRHASARHNTHPEATLLRGGMVVCGHCGRTMHSHRHRAGKTDAGAPMVWRYVCNRMGGPRCPAHNQNIATASLDAAVWTIFREYLLDPDRLRTLYDRLIEQTNQQRKEGDGQGLHLGKRVVELEEEVARLGVRLGQEDDAGIVGVLRNRLQQVLAEITSVRKLQENAEMAYAERQARLNRRMTFLEFAEKTREELRATEVPFALKRGLLDAWEVRVIVWRAARQPRWLVIFGFQTLVDDILAKQTTDFNMFFPGGTQVNDMVMQAAVADMQPAFAWEMMGRLKPSGLRPGPKSQVDSGPIENHATRSASADH